MKSPGTNPPLILCIETSTSVCSVAMFSGELLLELMEYNQEKVHARILMPVIDQICDKTETERSGISAVAVSAGPGSYTGLRIGVSVAKGLCMGLGIPLIGIGSLFALASGQAQSAQELNSQICIVQESGKTQVTMGFYSAKLREIMDVQQFQLEPGIEKHFPKGKILFAGNAVEALKKVMPESDLFIFRTDALFSARHFGPPACHKFLSEAFADIHKFEPVYVRDVYATRPKNKLI